MERLRRNVFRLGLFAVLAAGCAQVDETSLSQQTGLGTDLGSFQAPSPANDLQSSPTPADLAGDDLKGVDLSGYGAADLKGNSSGCAVSSVKVNELQTAGNNGATDEYVELYNPCTAAVTMTGAKIVYRSATGTSDASTFWTFTSETIAAGGYFVVANSGFTGKADASPFESSSGLAATAGGVALKDASGNVIDSVGYGSTATNAFVEANAASAPASAQSAGRTKDGVDTNDNAADFSLQTPTPGAKN